MQLRNTVRRILRKESGATSQTVNYLYSDFDDLDHRILSLVTPYTMTSKERIVALINAVKYVERYNIPGSFVECGVWKGGSAMVMAETLKALHSCERELMLYDTFKGMNEPTNNDKSYDNKPAIEQLQAEDSFKQNSLIWCYSTLEEVKTNLRKVSYPEEKIIYIEGKVEETLPKKTPDKIALLRLDTDWYESTKVELEYLFPKLVPGGVIIIDDYGHWKGCKKAVDEYLEDNNIPLLLNRIDYTGRIGIKVF